MSEETRPAVHAGMFEWHQEQKGVLGIIRQLLLTASKLSLLAAKFDLMVLM